jgi:hypothetical protein
VFPVDAVVLGQAVSSSRCVTERMEPLEELPLPELEELLVVDDPPHPLPASQPPLPLGVDQLQGRNEEPTEHRPELQTTVEQAGAVMQPQIGPLELVPPVAEQPQRLCVELVVL